MAEVSPRSVHVIDQYELVERIRRFPTPLHQIRPDNELPALDFTPDPNLNSPAITTDLSDDYIRYSFFLPNNKLGAGYLFQFYKVHF